MKRIFKKLISWALAFVLVAVLMNGAFALYSRTTGWIDRDKASTLAIYKPNSAILMGTEGRGYHRVDSRGYVNDADKLADNYIIAVGASHTQGKEIAQEKRYTDLMNAWLGYTDEAYVYNVSQDAYFFPDIAKGFSALTKEFPDSSKIIIEIGDTEFLPEKLQTALEQREYDEGQNGQNIMKGLSAKKRLVMAVKEYSPLLYNVSNKLNALKELKSTPSSPQTFDIEEYEAVLDSVMQMMTQIYSKEIIIMYHPQVEISNEALIVKGKETDEVFRRICEKNEITFVDMTDAFLSEYEKTSKVAYGFSNTSIGEGHLNETGHYLIAKELVEYIKEGAKQ